MEIVPSPKEYLPVLSGGKQRERYTTEDEMIQSITVLPVVVYGQVVRNFTTLYLKTRNIQCVTIRKTLSSEFT